MVRSTVLIYWSNSRLLGNSSEKFTCSIIRLFFPACRHAYMHSIAPSEVLQVVRIFVFIEDLQTSGMDPCMMQIPVFSIFFNMFEMSITCRHENTNVVIFITHFVSRERFEFQQNCKQYFFKQKKYIQCTSYCTSNSNSSL